MAKTKISEYDATAGNNTDINSINIDEGCSPSGINNAIRALMSHLKNWQGGTSGDSLPVASGGTGSTTAGAARTALSAAASGTNSDITSLTAVTSITGLTTALSTIQGGTGVIQKAISTVARTSNVVTITTSTSHGFTAGHYVTVAAVTNTSLNGTFLIASVGSTTFTYAQTASDLSSISDTGTATDITYCNLTNNVTGTLTVDKGGTSVVTNTPNAILTGNGTSAITSIKPSTNGNVLTSTAGSTITAGSFVVGAEYTILTVGTTSFTSIGASANTVGIVFTATGVGSGTGTATTNTWTSSASGGLGVSQTWTDVKSSRALGTTYTNSTGKPIQLGVTIQFPAQSNAVVSISINGTVIGTLGDNSTSQPSLQLPIQIIVPNGATYAVTTTVGSPSILYWAELR
jgi:hypothetical protein